MSFLLAFCSLFLDAQVLPQNRHVDWSKAGLDSSSLPSSWDSVVVTGSSVNLDSTGTFDNDQPFKLALEDFAAFPNPTVFIFPPGRYKFSQSIDVPAKRVIMGAGSDSTFILSSTKTHCFTIGKQKIDTARNAIGNLTKGSKTVTLGSVIGLEAGMWIDLYQANDSSKMATNNPGSWDQVWAKNSKGYISKIDFVDSSASSISLVTEAPFDLDDQGGNGYVRLEALEVVELVGFQDFTLKTMDSTMQGHSFYFRQVSNAWMCGLESAYTRKYHVALERCANISITGSYFHHSYNYGGGGSAYGVECGFHTSRVLASNNIFNWLRHSILLHLGANSNVYTYNYSINPFWSQFGTPADLVLHGHYPSMNLFEGNTVQQITAADYWGPSGPGNTFFRNRVEKKNFLIADRSHMQNLIANELPGPNSIVVASNVNGTILHGNSVSGTTSYDTSLSRNIPASLIYSSKPCFLAASAFPLIGPEHTYGTYTIPAQLRFALSKKTAPCKCKSTNSSSSQSFNSQKLRTHYIPASSSLLLWFDENAGPAKLQIFDLRGRLLLEENILSQRQEIRLNKSVEPPFLLMVESDNEIFSSIILQP